MSGTTIKSARRVFEVLEAFDAERRPLSLKDICARFRYPPSSGAGGAVSRLEKNEDAIVKALRRGVARFAKTASG